MRKRLSRLSHPSPIPRASVIEALERRRLLTANPTVIDLLVLYTTGARDSRGGDAAIQSQIQEQVDETNLALQNSQIPVIIRLVHSESIAYTGSGSVQTDELHLQDTTDGVMDSSLTTRNAWGADLVHLVTDNAFNQGGFAQVLDSLTNPLRDTLGYSAMDVSSLQATNGTMSHELGHNLGSGHERGNGNQGTFAYSWGYRYTSPTNGQIYHDIMSYGYGSGNSADLGLLLYANPNISYAGAPIGKPIGDPALADLYDTFIQIAPVVAQYRSPVVADTSGPLATLYDLEASGQTLTFNVRYRDDAGVDASSIDSNDVYVSTPEGFNLSAELLSISPAATNTFQKLATYRVVLPTSTEPLSSLHVFVRAAQVKDVLGNYSGAGQLNWSGGDNAGVNFQTARDLGAVSGTVVVQDSLDNTSSYDYGDVYKLTLTQPSTLSVHLSGLSADATVYLVKDANGNDRYDDSVIVSTYNPGVTTDRALSQVLSAGDYFLIANTVAPTPYTLAVSAFTDTIAPTATVDAVDVRAAGQTANDFAVTYTDDRDVDGNSVQYSGRIRVHGQLDNLGTADYILYPYPSLNPANVQTAPSIRAIYHLPPINSAPQFTSDMNGLYTITIDSFPGSILPHDVAGNNVPLLTLGSFHVALGAADASAPTVAAVSAAPVLTPGATMYDFTVTYHDNVALDANTFDGADIRVTGPHGFDQLASFISATPATAVGSNRTVTYRIIPQGGSWDSLDDGTYNIALQGSQVRDTATSPNAAAAVASIGTFTVHCPWLGDASGDDSVNSADFTLLAANFGHNGRGYGQGDFNFDGIVNSLDFNALASKFGTILPPAASPPAGADLGMQNVALSDHPMASLFGKTSITDETQDSTDASVL